MDNLTGTGLPSSPRRFISSTERRRVGASTGPARKVDPARGPSSATLGVSMLTTGIPLPRSAQTRVAQSLDSGHHPTPIRRASQLWLPRHGSRHVLPVNPYKVTSCDFSVRHFTCGRSLHRSGAASQTFAPPDIDRDVTALLSIATSGDRCRGNARALGCAKAAGRLAACCGLPGPAAPRRLTRPGRPLRPAAPHVVPNSRATGDTRVISPAASRPGCLVPAPPPPDCLPREPAAAGCP